MGILGDGVGDGEREGEFAFLRGGVGVDIEDGKR